MTNCDNCKEDLVYSANYYEVKYGADAFGLTRFICEKCYETTDLTKIEFTFYEKQNDKR